jgi:hypothetical protein
MEVLKSGRTFIALLVALALVASPAYSGEPNAIEYEVKAAFLFNFLKFVDWPAAPDGPWVIGVVGAGSFTGILEDTVRGKTVKGFPVTVKRLPGISAARGCHIVFVPMRVQAAFAPPPGVLTVGDDLHFLDAGGIVGFYLEEGKVRFEIQADAAKAAGLRVSAQLLKLGKIR